MNAPTSLIPLVEANPAMVLLEPVKFDQFYDEVAREVRSHVPDLTTEKGRKAVASLAFKVTKTKTAIDDARKALTEEKRAEIKKVDEAGKVIRDKLDSLRDEARAPLTQWEEAEKARAERCKAITDGIRRDSAVSLDDTSHTVAARLDAIKLIEITEAEFTETHAVAVALWRNAIEALSSAHVRLLREEDERAELIRLRAAEEERQRVAEQERQAAEAKAAEERAEQARKEEAARAADEAKAREEAEQARIAQAVKEAEETACRQAEQAAADALAAQQRAHDEALALERRRAEEAEADRKAQADRIAREEAKREADAKAEADAQAAREANRAHRGKIMLATKTAIMSHGVGEATAKALVLAISAGDIPHVSIKF